MDQKVYTTGKHDSPKILCAFNGEGSGSSVWKSLWETKREIGTGAWKVLDKDEVPVLVLRIKSDVRAFARLVFKSNQIDLEDRPRITVQEWKDKDKKERGTLTVWGRGTLSANGERYLKAYVAPPLLREIIEKTVCASETSQSRLNELKVYRTPTSSECYVFLKTMDERELGKWVTQAPTYSYYDHQGKEMDLTAFLKYLDHAMQEQPKGFTRLEP